MRVIKGEDRYLVSDLGALYPNAMLYLICDGHSGGEAAEYVCTSLERDLKLQLAEELRVYDPTSHPALVTFAERLRTIISELFVEIDNSWNKTGNMAGTTVTLCLVIGGLITVANLGDSVALLDTGCSILELTDPHRIETHVGERARLEALGCTIAKLGFHLQGPAKPGEPGVGPTRIWPGGLCVSRSVGDLDGGPHIVPLPHIKQVLAPHQGCRMIVASDGLWDVTSYSRAIKISRAKVGKEAACALVETVLRDQRFNDDTSVIVVDILPPDQPSFPNLALQLGLHPVMQERQKKPSGLCACFAPAVEELDAQSCQGMPGHLALLADVDMLVPFAREHGESALARTSLTLRAAAAVRAETASATGKPKDYAVHRGSEYNWGVW